MPSLINLFGSQSDGYDSYDTWYVDMNNHTDGGCIDLDGYNFQNSYKLTHYQATAFSVSFLRVAIANDARVQLILTVQDAKNFLNFMVNCSNDMNGPLVSPLFDK